MEVSRKKFWIPIIISGIIALSTVIATIITVLGSVKETSPMIAYFNCGVIQTPKDLKDTFGNYLKKLNTINDLKAKIEQGIYSTDSLPPETPPEIKQSFISGEINNLLNYFSFQEDDFFSITFGRINSYVYMTILNNSDHSVESVFLKIPKCSFVQIKRDGSDLKTYKNTELLSLNSFRPQEAVKIQMWGTNSSTSDLNRYKNYILRTTKLSHEGYNGLGKIIYKTPEGRTTNKVNYLVRAKTIFFDMIIILPILGIIYFYLRRKGNKTKDTKK